MKKIFTIKLVINIIAFVALIILAFSLSTLFKSQNIKKRTGSVRTIKYPFQKQLVALDKTSLDGEGNDPKPPVTDPDPEHIADNNLVAGSTIEVGDEIYTVDEKGNVVDLEATIQRVLNEFSNGTLGRFSLDGEDIVWLD